MLKLVDFEGNTVAAGHKEDSPHPVDVYVGARMRLCRVQLRLSQSDLANKLGISFQAVQKYETGEIRISASRLYEVARALGVAPGYFFEEYPDGHAIEAIREESLPGVDAFDRREIMSLVRGYFGIRDKVLQKHILRMITRMGNPAAEGDESDTAET